MVAQRVAMVSSDRSPVSRSRWSVLNHRRRGGPGRGGGPGRAARRQMGGGSKVSAGRGRHSADESPSLPRGDPPIAHVRARAPGPGGSGLSEWMFMTERSVSTVQETVARSTRRRVGPPRVVLEPVSTDVDPSPEPCPAGIPLDPEVHSFAGCPVPVTGTPGPSDGDVPALERNDLLPGPLPCKCPARTCQVDQVPLPIP
jgi:hypothetical protein